MLEIYDKSRKKIAILQNAYEINEPVKLNGVSELSFKLPLNDPKNEHCQPFNFVRYNGGDYYRIAPFLIDRDDTASISYTCEHAIVTLIDTLLFGHHIVGNLGVYTADVIRYVLKRQANWVLGRCEFSHQFEYGFEQESLLGALFSIPNMLTQKYKWTYDFSIFPWVVNLLKIDETGTPSLYVRAGKNLSKLSQPTEVRDICTRLYPLGAGEGINQLNIKAINGGVSYIQSPQEYVNKYGIIERVFIDRRYENAESLLQASKTLLAELQEPRVEYQVDYVCINGEQAPLIGDVVKAVDPETHMDIKTFVTAINYAHGDIFQSTVTLANKPSDLAASIADLADRQRIEMTYSQGATQLYAQSLQANADQSHGATLNFYIPNEMKIINKIIAKIKLEGFRAYSQATEGGGGSSQSSSVDGGGSTSTYSGGSASLNGGGYITSGMSSIDFSNWGKLYWSGLRVRNNIVDDFWLDFSGLSMPSNHQHNVNTAFSISVPSHSHQLNINAHAHSVTVEAHTHSVRAGIYTFGNPSSFGLYVNGSYKATFYSTTQDLDLTGYLISQGKIPRGNHHKIEIRPNDLAYISIDMFVQGFVQSRGDNTL